MADAQQHYRHYVIWRCPGVRFFDFQKVKDAERKRAKELFGTYDDPTPLAAKVRTCILFKRAMTDLINSRSWASSHGLSILEILPVQVRKTLQFGLRQTRRRLSRRKSVLRRAWRK